MISPNMVVDGLTWREATGSGTGKQVSIIIFGIFNIFYVYTTHSGLHLKELLLSYTLACHMELVTAASNF